MLRSRIAPLDALLVIFVFALASFSASALAQEKVLHTFTNPPSCSSPSAPLIADGAGNLYGTTFSGGTSGKYGCVFELSPNGSGGWNEIVLYNFSGGLDGGYPWAGLVFDKVGNLYGTTEGGGAYAVGTAFELSPVASGGWTETVLHDFGNGSDGTGPQSNLIFDKGGNLYGTTTFSGGTRKGGSVFKLSPGQNGWTETILYEFPASIGGPDGDVPAGGVVMDRKGNLYGATQAGGAGGYGAVYRLALLKDGSYGESVIHSFSLSDGFQPQSGLTIDRNGTLYGTTISGGDIGGCLCGIVFRLKKDATGSWTENVLHQLTGNDGSYALGPVVFDSLGNLFAVAQSGGGTNAAGTVFELMPAPSGPWNDKVLHIFDLSNTTDGAAPYAGAIISHGQLFGTTASGGPDFNGTVFEITLPAPGEP
jgi:uncharacterized repeat protein (TIGR03803 family)